MNIPPMPPWFSESLRHLHEQARVIGYVRGFAGGYAGALAKRNDLYSTPSYASDFIAGFAKALLEVVEYRELPITSDQQRRITECTDPAMLDGWLDRVLLVASVDELFAPPDRDADSSKSGGFFLSLLRRHDG